MEEIFFDLLRMHKARPTADLADLEAKLNKVVADIAAGSARSICLDGGTCVAKLKDGALELAVTATDGLRLVFRAKRDISVDTLMSLLGQANEAIRTRETHTMDEIADAMATRGASFTRRKRGSLVLHYGPARAT